MCEKILSDVWMDIYFIGSPANIPDFFFGADVPDHVFLFCLRRPGHGHNSGIHGATRKVDVCGIEN